MGCNCGKQKRVETKVIMGEPTHQFVTIPVVTMVPEPTPTPLPEEDHFNNIDTITPIDNG
jgi:hypothetical protein